MKNQEENISTQLLNIKDISDRLRMSVSKINSLISKGELLGVFKIGRTRHILETDLYKYINDQMKKCQ